MVDPRTDEERIMGIVQAEDMDPIPMENEYNLSWTRKVRGSEISAGDSDLFYFEPSTTDVAWLILGFRFVIPSNTSASSGDQTLEIKSGASEIAKFEGPYNENLELNYGTLKAGTTKKPASVDTFYTILFRKVVTDGIPLTLLYTNNTDAKQTADREFDLYRQEVRKTT